MGDDVEEVVDTAQDEVDDEAADVQAAFDELETAVSAFGEQESTSAAVASSAALSRIWPEPSEPARRGAGGGVRQRRLTGRAGARVEVREAPAAAPVRPRAASP